MICFNVAMWLYVIQYWVLVQRLKGLERPKTYLSITLIGVCFCILMPLLCIISFKRLKVSNAFAWITAITEWICCILLLDTIRNLKLILGPLFNNKHVDMRSIFLLVIALVLFLTVSMLSHFFGISHQ